MQIFTYLVISGEPWLFLLKQCLVPYLYVVKEMKTNILDSIKKENILEKDKINILLPLNEIKDNFSHIPLIIISLFFYGNQLASWWQHNGHAT